MPAPRLILASRSPQRQAILRQAGISFEVRVPEVEEREAGEPAEVAQENARRKATAVAPSAGDLLVLGVDTIVATDDGLYGKPAGPEQARRTLSVLSGGRHEVISGICLIRADTVRTAHARTAVSFRRLSEAWLDWYLASGEWRERAGGYAIQGRGAVLVRGIDGDYLNVVGLPLARLLDLEPGLIVTD